MKRFADVHAQHKYLHKQWDFFRSGSIDVRQHKTKQNKKRNIYSNSFICSAEFFLKKNTRLILINRFRNTKTKKHEIPFLYLLITNIANITFDINVLK